MKKLRIRKGTKHGCCTVIRELPKRGCQRQIECSTDCGKIMVKYIFTLATCPCQAREGVRKRNFERRAKPSSHYTKWHRKLSGVYAFMISRCYNKEAGDYPNYGGRGIKVCKKWYHDREAFIVWARRNGWQPGLQLDRRDNDVGYRPSNCRFVTPKVNASNRRNTIFYKGLCLRDAVERYAADTPYQTVYYRIHNMGWTLAQALTTPVIGGMARPK